MTPISPINQTSYSKQLIVNHVLLLTKHNPTQVQEGHPENHVMDQRYKPFYLAQQIKI